MKIKMLFLISGILLLLLPATYTYFTNEESVIIAVAVVLLSLMGYIFVRYSFDRRKNYKLNDVRNGKIFEIMSISRFYNETSVGIRFKENEEQYFISPIPEELKGAVCKEKYCKQKNKIVKIE